MARRYVISPPAEDFYARLLAVMVGRADATAYVLDPSGKAYRAGVWTPAAVGSCGTRAQARAGWSGAGVVLIQILESHRRAVVLATAPLPLPDIDTEEVCRHAFKMDTDPTWTPGQRLVPAYGVLRNAPWMAAAP